MKIIKNYEDTYLLQLSAYLVNKINAEVIQEHYKAQKAKAIAEHAILEELIPLMIDVNAKREYAKDFKKAIEAYLKLSIPLPPQLNETSIGGVVVQRNTLNYIDGKNSSIRYNGTWLHRTDEKTLATPDQISRFFLTLRLFRTEADGKFHSFELARKYNPKGGVKGVGRIQRAWCREAIDSMFNSSPSIEAVEGLTKQKLLDILKERMTDELRPTFKHFIAVLEEDVA